MLSLFLSIYLSLSLSFSLFLTHFPSFLSFLSRSLSSSLVLPLPVLSFLSLSNHFRRNPASTRLAFALLLLLCSSASSALLVLFCFFRFVQSSSPARESLAATRLPLEAAIQKRKRYFYGRCVSHVDDVCAVPTILRVFKPTHVCTSRDSISLDLSFSIYAFTRL